MQNQISTGAAPNRVAAGKQAVWLLSQTKQNALVVLQVL